MRPTPLAAAALAAACVPSLAPAHGWWCSTSGDGEVVAQARQVAGFDRVRLLAPLDVEVAEGPAHAVEVTIDRNLQPLVETRLEGRTLVLDTRGSIDHRGTGKVRLSLPELRGFAIEGSGDAQIAGADLPRDVELAVAGSGDLRWKGKARRLRVAIEGSGDVRVEGAAEGLDAGVSGSGDVHAQGLTARGASLAISGSGDIAVTLDGGRLSAAVDGSGDITWWGKADGVSAAVSGSGSIRHR